MTGRLRFTTRSAAAVLTLTLSIAACTGSDGTEGDAAPSETTSAASPSPLVQLLANGQAVFGRFSGQKSMEGGLAIMAEERADFQLYSMESGPWDIPLMQEYMAGMVEAGGETAHDDFPIIVRTPAVHTDPEAVSAQVDEAMAAGIAGITFPHVTTAEEAAQTAAFLGNPWPTDPSGGSLNILIVEDQEGIGNVREIMQTPGLSVVFAGPGDLQRAYEGDMEAVENAIQAVLAACLEFDVACGVTAGVDDITTRLDQGFRVIIVTQDEAIAIGMAHAGRTAALTRGDGADR